MGARRARRAVRAGLPPKFLSAGFSEATRQRAPTGQSRRKITPPDLRWREEAGSSADDDAPPHQRGVERAEVVDGAAPGQADRLRLAVPERAGLDDPAADRAAPGAVGDGVLDLADVEEANAVARADRQLLRPVEVLAELHGRRLGRVGRG